MYIISCPVSASVEDYCDDRLDRALERERDLLDASEIAEAIPDSDICIPDLADAYVALADASSALRIVIDTFGSEMMPGELAVLRELASIAKCAEIDVEKVADALAAERLWVEA